MMDRLRNEDGMTITELTVVMAMLLVVLGSFLTVLESVNKGVQVQQERSSANDEARLAVERLDREIRSGNVLYNPSAETPAFYSFRVYTQANATTRTPSFVCSQWQVDGNEQLIRRQWPPGEPENASEWRTQAESIVNRSLSPQVPAFALDPDLAKGNRMVDITLMVDIDVSEVVTRPVRIQTSLTGRNTSYGFPADVCAPAPA